MITQLSEPLRFSHSGELCVVPPDLGLPGVAATQTTKSEYLPGPSSTLPTSFGFVIVLWIELECPKCLQDP